MVWFSGGVVPGDEGGKYHPEGYHIDKVGPKGLEGKGNEEMEKTRDILHARRLACPFGS
jgi:hypothetical protein